MSYFRADKSHGELVINGHSLHTLAWCVRDIRPLYYPDRFRGNNLIIPQAAGQRAYPYRQDQTDHVLPMFFTPANSTAGTDWSNRFVGYQSNIAEFKSYFLTPPSSPTATLAATISTPSGTTLSASVQVLGFEIGATEDAIMSPNVWRCSLGLRIPAGCFT